MESRTEHVLITKARAQGMERIHSSLAANYAEWME